MYLPHPSPRLGTYRVTNLKAANELKLATGPYKAARDAYVAATATYTKSVWHTQSETEDVTEDTKSRWQL